MREYSFDLEEKKQQEMKQLSVHKKQQYVSQTSCTTLWSFWICVCVVVYYKCASPQGTFVRWLKVNFSEVFVAWIHLKALRVFVESALRSVLIILVIFSHFLLILIIKSHVIHFLVISMFG